MNLSMLLGIVLLMALCYVALKSMQNAGYGIAFCWSLFPCEQVLQQAFPVLQRHPQTINVLFGATMILCVARMLNRHNTLVPRMPSEAACIYLLILLAALSFFWSVAPSATITHLIRHLPYLVVFVLLTPFCFLDKESMTVAVRWTICLGGLVMCCLAAGEFGSRGLRLESLGDERLEGNPLAVASYASTVIFCCGFTLLIKPVSIAPKYGMIFVSGIAIYVLLQSQSRGQLVALAVSAIVWLPFTRASTGRGGTVRVLATGGFVALGLGVFVLNSDFDHRWQMKFLSQGTGDRIAMISGVLKDYQAKGPAVWLSGLGSSASFYIVGFYPHNVPIEILTEEGSLGFALFGIAVWSTFQKAVSGLRDETLPEHARFNLGILCGLATFHLLVSLKEGSLLSSGILLSVICSVNVVRDRYCSISFQSSQFTRRRGMGSAANPLPCK